MPIPDKFLERIVQRIRAAWYCDGPEPIRYEVTIPPIPPVKLEIPDKAITVIAQQCASPEVRPDDSAHKLAATRALLNQCLTELKSLESMHASQYAKRRYDELVEKVSELDSL